MKVITVGRDSANDVVVNDIKVSRVHLQIVQNDEGICSVVDLGSSNGTFVNGRKITGETRLQPSDVIRIGNTTLAWSKYIKPDSKESNTDNGRNSQVSLSRRRLYVAAAIALLIMLCGVTSWYLYHNKQRQKDSNNQNRIENLTDSLERVRREAEDSKEGIEEYEARLSKAYKTSDNNASKAAEEAAKRKAAEDERNKAAQEAEDTKARATKDSISVRKHAKAEISAIEKDRDARIKAAQEDIKAARDDAAKRIDNAKEEALQAKLELEFIKNIEPKIKGNNNCLEDICKHFGIAANNKERLDSIKTLFDNADNQKRQEIIDVCNLTCDFESNLKKLKDSATQQQLLGQLEWQDLLQEMYTTDVSGQKTFSFDSQKFRDRFANFDKSLKTKVVRLLKAAANKLPAKTNDAQLD